MRPVVMLSRLGGRDAGKALVMAQVEVGLGPVIGDEHLAVLIRRHGARIHVQIGVEFTQPDRISRACKSAPSAAEARPLPREETTPPVMKIYRAMGGLLSAESRRTKASVLILVVEIAVKRC
jgi:hypothetical protein